MTEDMRSGIAFGIMIAIALIGYIGMFRKGRPKYHKFIEAAKRRGTFVTATAVDTKYMYTDRKSDNAFLQHNQRTVIYEYVVDGKTYHKKLVFESPGTVTIDYPYTVTVYYHPDNPSKGICPQESTVAARNSWGCLFTIVGAFAAFFLVYFLLGKL